MIVEGPLSSAMVYSLPSADFTASIILLKLNSKLTINKFICPLINTRRYQIFLFFVGFFYYSYEEDEEEEEEEDYDELPES